MKYKFIELEIKDYIAEVELARLDSLNALSLEFSSEIADVFQKLGTRNDVRVIILTSKARIFCSGLDIKEVGNHLLKASAKSMNESMEKERLQPFFDSCNSIEECPKPVIAAVHSRCIGGGLDIISACDIRLCTEDASFSLREAGIGLVADMGVLQRLPLIIGQGFTRQMAFTAAEYPAQEAEKMGLVNAIYKDKDSLMAGAKKLAAEIAQNAPLGVRATKEVLNYSRYTDVKSGMAMALKNNLFLMSSDDFKEAIAAFVEKRPPKYKGQ